MPSYFFLSVKKETERHPQTLKRKKEALIKRMRAVLRVRKQNSRKESVTQRFYSCLRCHSGTKSAGRLENHLLLMTMKPHQTRNQQRNCGNEDVGGKTGHSSYEST